jgi:hypothetical protein
VIPDHHPEAVALPPPRPVVVGRHQPGVPKVFAVPELTVPRPAAHRLLPPAALIRNVAADADSWRHLLRYEPDAPSRVPLPVDHPDIELWLTGWLPGQSVDFGDGAPDVFAVVRGEVTECAPSGVRTVRAGQVRILSGASRLRLANLHSEPAITMHARRRGG